MKKTSIIFALALLLVSTLAAPEEIDHQKALLVHGVLKRNNKAATEWILKPGESLVFRGQAITTVSFVLAADTPWGIYAPYEGKEVELVGDVDHVSQGNAVLGNIRTIGLVSLPQSFLAHRFGSQPNNPLAADPPPGRVAYKHAYYLFLASTPDGCEACYVPLLITQQPLEEIARGKESKLCVLLYTYERDSLWEIKGATPVAPVAVETQPRTIHLVGRTYRYQEISAREVVKLLEDPMGTIPISRPVLLNKSVIGASLKELIQDFRGLMR